MDRRTTPKLYPSNRYSCYTKSISFSTLDFTFQLGALYLQDQVKPIYLLEANKIDAVELLVYQELLCFASRFHFTVWYAVFTGVGQPTNYIIAINFVAKKLTQ